MSSIGDIVLSTSFLKSVKQKYPDAEIHFLIKKEFAELVKKHPSIALTGFPLLTPAVPYLGLNFSLLTSY